MYAVIATGGKQYTVKPGDEVVIEKLTGNVGDAVELRAVMVVDDEGKVETGPTLDKNVKATITAHGKGKKIVVFTYKNKSRQRKKNGHRQHLTTVKIDTI